MKILYLPNEYSQQRQREKKGNIYPVLMAMEASYHRKQGHDVVWDGHVNDKYDKVVTEAEGLPFLELPRPDRVWTRWWEYQNNGNFKYLPGTYIQSARDCWWRRCTFCKWAKKFAHYEVRPLNDVIGEIEDCRALGVKEIFDDSGTFPTGMWFHDFLNYMWNNPIPFSCNMRFTNKFSYEYKLMKQAGFRMILFGLESANQKTLDTINKGINIDHAVAEIVRASQAGIDVHVAVMFGYPWEDDDDSVKTLKLVWWLLKKGYVKTAQASLYDPPDGKRNEGHRKYVKKFYSIVWHPRFMLTKLLSLKGVDDVKFYWRALKLIWK